MNRRQFIQTIGALAVAASVPVVANSAVATIPQGVLDDIQHHYTTVIFANYGKSITEKCLTKKSNYVRLVEQDAKGILLDSVTFEPKEYIGDRVESYIVRGIFTETSADVYSIISIGTHVRCQNERANC